MRISLPEQVWIDLEPASFGSRALAYMLDFTIRWTAFGLILLTFIILANLMSGSPLLDIPASVLPWEAIKEHGFVLAMSLLALLYFVMEWGYPIYFEVYHGGVSPGKRAFSLRVVDENGLPITFNTSLLRTALISIDMLPTFGFLAFCSMVLSKKNQRLGDLVAGTMVVHEHTALEPQIEKSTDQSSVLLPLKLYSILGQFVSRRDSFAKAARDKTVLTAIKALETQCPDIEVPGAASAQELEEWLIDLYRRARPSKKTEAISKHDVSIDWKLLEGELAQAERELSQLEQRDLQKDAKLLRKVADTYQVLCQRYAYLSTFYPNTSEAMRASYLVRKGRILIYGNRLSKLGERSLPFYSRVQLAFHRIRGHVALSGILGVAGALVTAMLVQVHPELAWSFLSEQLAATLSRGEIWTDEIQGVSSLAASRIMTNNITVTLSAFALGITAGVGTAFIITFNGVHLGGIFSSLSFYDMDTRLWDFVVAHGVLELSVIVVAGGCGLYLGDAIIHPGSLTRKAALGKHARELVSLIVFNALALVLAGVVEGFISPYPTSFYLKLALGLLLGGLYWLLLINPVKQSTSKANLTLSP